MKLKDAAALLLLLIIIVTPWLLGWYDAMTMGIVAFLAFSAGVITQLVSRPRKSTLVFAGNLYQIGHTSKGVRVESPAGQIIIDRFLVKAGFLDQRGNLVDIKLKFSGFEFEKESRTLIQKFSNHWLELQLTLSLKNQHPAIHLAMKAFIHQRIPEKLLHDDGNLRMHSIEVQMVFPYDLPLRELYLKNRTRTIRPPLGWIWLDKQGVSLGRGSRSFHLYHTPGISSMRYRRYPHRLSLFIDHADDHWFTKASPSEHAPEYADWRHSLINSGGQISAHCQFLAGIHPDVQPLIWMHPKGHDATLIWTTHPDNSTLGTTKAVTLGDSAAGTNEAAVAGFVAHGIPLTMGVFHRSTHPRHLALFDHPDSEPYRDLVFRLQKEGGFEIALHTASDQCSSRPDTEAALQYVTRELGAKTWIDHSANLQRTSLSGDGVHAQSLHYILDLLNQFGMRYVWHYGSEKKYLKGYDILDDAHGIDLLQTGRPGGKARHTPVFWKHPTQLGLLISWKTQAIGRLRHFPMSGLQWLVWFSQKLEALIQNHGVAIIHDYPFWRYTKRHLDGNGIYCRHEGLSDSDDRWIIDPDFNLLLENISRLQKHHQLHCSTIQAFLDHQTLMETIVFEFVDRSTTRIINPAAHPATLILAYPAGATPRGNGLKFIREGCTQPLYQLRLPPHSEALIISD